MKKSWIIILILAVIILGIIAGTAIYEKNKQEISKKNIAQNIINEVSEIIIDECTEEWEELQEEALDIEANSNEEKISPNCVLTLKRNYKECSHTINEYVDIPQSLVNKTKEDLQKEYPNWEISKYSSIDIVLYREFDSDCGRHFVLRNDEGKITVYRTNENNEEEVYEKTEISVDYLTETDKIEIENGIKVNGIEELKQLIEDFE